MLFSSPLFQKGFSLIELTVALGLFLLVLTIATGSFIHVLQTQRQISGFLSAGSNVNLMLEQMAREVRTGIAFCAPNPDPVSAISNELMFTNAQGQPVDYRLRNGAIERGVGGIFSPVTSGNVTIQYLNFVLTGQWASDSWPPRVTVSLGISSNEAGASTIVNHIQTTVSSRPNETDFAGVCPGSSPPPPSPSGPPSPPPPSGVKIIWRGPTNGSQDMLVNPKLSFPIPGLYSISVTAPMFVTFKGAAGGGGSGGTTHNAGSGGGGGGAVTNGTDINLLPANTYSLLVGVAGAAGGRGDSNGQTGGITFFVDVTNGITWVSLGGGEGGAVVPGIMTPGSGGIVSGATTNGVNGGAGGSGGNLMGGIVGGSAANGAGGGGGGGFVPNSGPALPGGDGGNGGASGKAHNGSDGGGGGGAIFTMSGEFGGGGAGTAGQPSGFSTGFPGEAGIGIFYYGGSSPPPGPPPPPPPPPASAPILTWFGPTSGVRDMGATPTLVLSRSGTYIIRSDRAATVTIRGVAGGGGGGGADAAINIGGGDGGGGGASDIIGEFVSLLPSHQYKAVVADGGGGGSLGAAVAPAGRSTIFSDVTNGTVWLSLNGGGGGDGNGNSAPKSGAGGKVVVGSNGIAGSAQNEDLIGGAAGGGSGGDAFNTHGGRGGNGGAPGAPGGDQAPGGENANTGRGGGSDGTNEGGGGGGGGGAFVVGFPNAHGGGGGGGGGSDINGGSGGAGASGIMVITYP